MNLKGHEPKRKLALAENVETAVEARSYAASGSASPTSIRTYLPLLAKIDAQTHTANSTALNEQIRQLKDELSRLTEPMLGLLAPCYLGDDFEVHILDLSGQCILNHYRRKMPLPPAFEKARALAASRKYPAVEVYESHVRCVRDDGTTLRVDLNR